MKTSNSPGRRRKNTSKKRKWSAAVSHNSNALDLKRNIFSDPDPEKIARSLKRSAQRSRRRKGTAYQSAMSMLNFYINRAGKKLPEKQQHILEKSKDALRHLFHKD